MWNLISGLTLTFGMLAVTVADDVRPEPSVAVQFCGRLRDGVMAIGGETTGTTISFKRMIWEVQLRNDADRQFAKNHHKKTVVVSGSLRKVSGIETKDRWIIDVKQLSEQDATKHKAGVRMAILGTLRAADSRDFKASSMTIDSAGKIWPIDLSSDAVLKTTAESLVGQSVFLMGRLKQGAEEKLDAPPVIHVRTLKRPPNVPVRGRTN